MRQESIPRLTCTLARVLSNETTVRVCVRVIEWLFRVCDRFATVFFSTAGATTSGLLHHISFLFVLTACFESIAVGIQFRYAL